MRGNGRGRRCNLSQEQILGEAGIGLITDVVASSTKSKKKQKQYSTTSNMVVIIYCFIGCKKERVSTVHGI